MAYFDGFVLAVPTADKQKFIDHAKSADAVFIEQGATRVVEAWGDDVPKGKVTDFQGAVQAKEDETVAFSWIEYPDKEARQSVAAKMEGLMQTDDRFNPETNPMPFDGKRMIYGGFEPLLDEGESRDGSYIDGFVLTIPEDKKQAYLEMATKAWPLFKEFGAYRLVEAWGDDVPEGKVTDFRRAVQAKDGEQVVFSFIEWPDKATRDAGQKKMMEQDHDGEMPFDGQRMIWGGFKPVVEL